MTPPRRGTLISLLAMTMLAGLTWLVYAPGLSGGFLFDDFANLPALGATGTVDDWTTFFRYITSGTADPTGRPLAMLSFLIDARNWPADPRPFLRTNLVIHLLNGLLLMLLLRQLGRRLVGNCDSTPLRYAQRERGGERSGVLTPLRHAQGEWGGSWRIDLAALLGAAFWLLHPLLVSTTLYIVQREAMLPATFVLLGLLAWLHGRGRMLVGHTASGLLWLLAGLGGCTALAMLSKANGILLPALALTLEYTVLRSGEQQTASPRADSPIRATLGSRLLALLQAKHTVNAGAAKAATKPRATQARPSLTYRRALLVLGWFPALFVAGYLLLQGWQGLMHGISGYRPWTLGQRLLTEPRILLQYLELLWLPRPFTPGLFNDAIQVSTSLLHPATTLPAVLVVIGLIVTAIALRRRWPALAAAVLFYFVGQSLESSTIALELYYEHRNYLPALLMFWPLALWLTGARRAHQRAGGTKPAQTNVKQRQAPRQRFMQTGQPLSGKTVTIAKLTLALLLVAGLGLMSHARAGLWGNQHGQALMWARLNPHSPRALAYAAQTEIRVGRPRRAIRMLQPARAAAPTQIQLAFNLMAAECATGRLTPATLEATRYALRHTVKTGSLLTHWFMRQIEAASNPVCPQMSLDTLTGLLQATLDNPQLMKRDGRRQDVHYLLGRIALARGNAPLALKRFNRALEQYVRPGAALKQAAVLGASGYPRLGLKHLEHYEAIREQRKQPGLGMKLIHQWVLELQNYWGHELTRMRHNLLSDSQRPDRGMQHDGTDSPSRRTLPRQTPTNNHHKPDLQDQRIHTGTPRK